MSEEPPEAERVAADRGDVLRWRFAMIGVIVTLGLVAADLVATGWVLWLQLEGHRREPRLQCSVEGTVDPKTNLRFAFFRITNLAQAVAGAHIAASRTWLGLIADLGRLVKADALWQD